MNSPDACRHTIVRILGINTNVSTEQNSVDEEKTNTELTVPTSMAHGLLPDLHRAGWKCRRQKPGMTANGSLTEARSLDAENEPNGVAPPVAGKDKGIDCSRNTQARCSKQKWPTEVV